MLLKNQERLGLKEVTVYFYLDLQSNNIKLEPLIFRLDLMTKVLT